MKIEINNKLILLPIILAVIILILLGCFFFIKSPESKNSVQIFFNKAGQAECESDISVNRKYSGTDSMEVFALNELLSGPTEKELSSGYSTSINSGVKLLSFNIDEKGYAHADFSKELGEGVAGSCKVSGIRAQIQDTLMQFDEVKWVIISIEGQSEDILQP